MTSSNTLHIPAHKTPYSGIRKDGDNKRAYTLASFAESGLIQWDAKAGKIVGFGKGNLTLLSSLLGNSAYSHWTRTTGRIDTADSTLAVIGRNEVTGSLIGKGNLNTIPGLVTANLTAFHTGILKEPGTGNVMERWNATVEVKATTATTTATTKATTATKATKATTATATATKATTKATKATKATPILITPEAK